VDLFEEQVARTPDAIAVAFEDQQLSYRALDECSSQLARHLRHCGVEAEVLVGVQMERSLEILVALLGVLKAGGAYMRLDPSWPNWRQRFMLECASATVPLRHDRLRADDVPTNAHVVSIEGDWSAIPAERSERLASSVSANGAAYVVYTSGSTGKPKG